MAFPLTLYMPVRQGFFNQLVMKIAYIGHWIQTKPTADTGLIHYSRLILVPNSPKNKGRAHFFKKTKGFMLVTTFDGGMIPYFRAFWDSKEIRRTFNRLRLFALDPPPARTGNDYVDYNNFQTWLTAQDIQTEGFFCAYPQTLEQIRLIAS